MSTARPAASTSSPAGERQPQARRWQTYDVIWTAPTFNADGSLKSPAYVTAFHNGVLIQNHFELKGETVYIGKPEYKKFGRAHRSSCKRTAIRAQPISFRNIWIREL